MGLLTHGMTSSPALAAAPLHDVDHLKGAHTGRAILMSVSEMS